MIVVDTSVWINHLTQRTDRRSVQYLRSLENAGDVLVGDIVLMQLLQGTRNAEHARQLLRGLEPFPKRCMLDLDLAVAAALHYRRLRGLGITVAKTADLVIATFCIATGAALLTDDADFAPFAAHCGLTLV